MRRLPKPACALAVFVSITTVLAVQGLALADDAEVGTTMRCKEEASQGFLWDEAGTSEPTEFAPESYDVTIVSENLRHIFLPGLGRRFFDCEPLAEGQSTLLRCTWQGTVFIFNGDAFTTAYLFGQPIGGDRNLAVAYGHCGP